MLHLRNLSYIVCWVVALFVAAEASVVVIEPVDLLPAPSAGFVDWPSVDCHLRVVIGIDPAAGWDQSTHSPHSIVGRSLAIVTLPVVFLVGVDWFVSGVDYLSLRRSSSRCCICVS